ncbi:hypothetical protein C1878_12645 [Gordonibacter sp. 28C]|uniref:protease inhibitor I42 family protein n=1 Tax=Gordonibacter sp. 28C TaxID=2078569 RepID=UPI000DF74515|nr:protease inhibitor I42 family protein [Gordonibacter sp. 28C]RDB60890.1 hypothetical protein C1878_12645 [Gordonibacter sp. 28C]
MSVKTNGIERAAALPRLLMAAALCALALVAAAALSSCGGQAKSTVAVTLESQAGTGYQWTYVASPDDVFKETGHETKADNSKAGGTVTDTFTFQAQKGTGSDDASITFLLERPWLSAEEDEGTQTVQYVFKVGDDKNVTLSYTNGENAPDPVIS